MSMSDFEIRIRPIPRSERPRSFREAFHELSPRLLAIAELAATGLRNREIAKQLGTTQLMIRNYLSIIYRRLNAESKFDLALRITRMREEDRQEAFNRAVAEASVATAEEVALPPFRNHSGERGEWAGEFLS